MKDHQRSEANELLQRLHNREPACEWYDTKTEQRSEQRTWPRVEHECHRTKTMEVEDCVLKCRCIRWQKAAGAKCANWNLWTSGSMGNPAGVYPISRSSIRFREEIIELSLISCLR